MPPGKLECGIHAADGLDNILQIDINVGSD
jgi:hypothetical protein